MSGDLDWRHHQQPGAEQESNRLNLKSFKQQKHLSQTQTTASGSYRLKAFLLPYFLRQNCSEDAYGDMSSV